MKAYFKLCLTVLAIALVVLVIIVLTSRTIRAAGPWYVAPGGDDGNDCLSPGAPCATINGAIGKATSGDTIYVATGTYTGTGDEVVLLDKDATLSGGWDEPFTTQSGRSTIDGEGMRRGILVNSGVPAVVERFTVQNGSVGGYDLGGGIYNQGTLALNNCTISGNSADWAGGGGGIGNDGTLTLNSSTVSDNNFSGIYNHSGTLTLNGSTVSGNTAISGFPCAGGGGGGGIGIGTGIVTLNNSTVSGNAAGYRGGGIDNYGGTLALNHSTVTDNWAALGGGIYGTVTLQNSILADNAAESAPDCSGTIDTLGYNLIGDTSGCAFTPGPGDLTNVSANLGPLVGSPGYHPLFSGSPAIDAVPLGSCTLPTDERSVARPQGAACDMGAYEYTTPGPPASVLPHAGTPQAIPPLLPLWVPLQALVLDGIGTPVEGATVSFSAPSSGASGIFADSGTPSTTVVAHESGIATAAMFTANGLSGSYAVTATVSGVVTPAGFLLSNLGWYVAPGGSDANDCHTPTTPCATVNGAIEKPGFAVDDTAVVASGTYIGISDSVVLLDRGVRLSGGWDGTFTTQEGMSTIDGEGARTGISVDNDVVAVVERFIIQNGSNGIDNAGTLTLNNSTISGNTGRGIWVFARFGGSFALTLNNSTVSGNIGSGISNGAKAVLNNSTVSGNTGGGISNAASCSVPTLVLSNSTISGNTATSGGGISNGGTLVLNNSAVSGNTASNGGGGGGISNGGTLVLNNSTVSGNSGTGYYARGGGIINGFGVTSILNNSTVSGNSINGDGGGIYNHDGTVTLQNTILAGNSASGAGPDCSGYAGSGPGSAGYNLVGDTSDCNFTPATGDLTNIEAQLGTFEGSPGYHPLKFTSPAIDAGNPAGCTDHLGDPLTTDQRGSARPLDGDGDGEAICDIGSYEFDPDETPITSVYLPIILRYH